MVTPGPSAGGAGGEVVRGLEAAAGRELDAVRELEALREFEALRELEAERELDAERAAFRAEEPEPPDAETGRLAVRGAPGRLLVMPEGYSLGLGPQAEKRGKAEAPA